MLFSRVLQNLKDGSIGIGMLLQSQGKYYFTDENILQNKFQNKQHSNPVQEREKIKVSINVL